MPQLHFSIGKKQAEDLAQAARAAGLTLSQYLARLVGQQGLRRWPDGYFEKVVGSAAGIDLQEPGDLSLDDVKL